MRWSSMGVCLGGPPGKELARAMLRDADECTCMCSAVSCCSTATGTFFPVAVFRAMAPARVLSEEHGSTSKVPGKQLQLMFLCHRSPSKHACSYASDRRTLGSVLSLSLSIHTYIPSKKTHRDHAHNACILNMRSPPALWRSQQASQRHEGCPL